LQRGDGERKGGDGVVKRSDLPEIRKFNGENYYYQHSRESKRVAKQDAKRLRGQGFKARIVPWRNDGKTWYAVYRRKK